MAQRTIVWTSRAKQQLNNILSYYTQRNKSNLYSQSLHTRIQQKLHLYINQPLIGKKVKKYNVRVLFIDHCCLFYKTTKEHFIVLDLWDGRRNPESIRYYKND